MTDWTSTPFKDLLQKPFSAGLFVAVLEVQQSGNSTISHRFLCLNEPIQVDFFLFSFIFLSFSVCQKKKKKTAPLPPPLVCGVYSHVFFLHLACLIRQSGKSRSPAITEQQRPGLLTQIAAWPINRKNKLAAWPCWCCLLYLHILISAIYICVKKCTTCFCSFAYVMLIVIKIEVTGTWRVIYVIHIYIKYNCFC